MNISVVVPLYNEKDSLAALTEKIVKTLSDWGRSYEIVYVDDGSTDGSFELLERLYTTRPAAIRVVRFSRNYGKSAALQVGIDHARGDVIVTMDADLQDDPSAIPDIVSKLEEGWDVVSGWKKKRRDPISKILPSKIFNFVTSLLSGIRLHDFNCGFKAYRADVAGSLVIYGERHRFLPALAHWDGFRVTEIPVPHHPRRHGRSKYGMNRFTNGLFDLITLLFLRRYLKNPLHFFGMVGLILGFAGTCVLGYFGIQWVVTGHMHIRPLTLLSLGAVIMGIQFISIGLIGEMITHSLPRSTYTIRQVLQQEPAP